MKIKSYILIFPCGTQEEVYCNKIPKLGDDLEIQDERDDDDKGPFGNFVVTRVKHVISVGYTTSQTSYIEIHLRKSR